MEEARGMRTPSGLRRKGGGLIVTGAVLPTPQANYGNCAPPRGFNINRSYYGALRSMTYTTTESNE